MLVATAAGLVAFGGNTQPSLADGNSQTLLQKVEALEVALAKRTNSAYVFIKPHAVNDKVVSLVKDTFADTGIAILTEGVLDYKTIDEKLLIDNHYGAIASKAMKVDPKDLAVTPKAQKLFKDTFGLTWEEALKQGKVYNAAQACTKWGVDGVGLDKRWSAIDKKKELVKFGGGFYCAKVEGIFIINGFYMAMRGKFTEAPAKIHYFSVEWDAATLSWEDFRGKVLGATDPTTAAEGSLRRTIFNKWQELDLATVPFTGDNGVHASASPFEALSERCNWLGADLVADPYGAALIASGVPAATLKLWAEDPQVTVSADGTKGSLFDALEDTDAAVCAEKAKRIHTFSK